LSSQLWIEQNRLTYTTQLAPSVSFTAPYPLADCVARLSEHHSTESRPGFPDIVVVHIPEGGFQISKTEPRATPVEISGQLDGAGGRQTRVTIHKLSANVTMTAVLVGVLSVVVVGAVTAQGLSAAWLLIIPLLLPILLLQAYIAARYHQSILVELVRKTLDDPSFTHEEERSLVES
jgi:hypothetical protein